MPPLRIGIVGAGKVGQTLARLWHDRGYSIVGVYSRNQHKASALAQAVDAPIKISAMQVVLDADLTLLTVSDDAISSFATEIAEQLPTGDYQHKAIIHTSGAHDVHSLQTLTEHSFMTGSLHPIFPFADVNTAIAKLPGSAFALETTHDRLNEWLQMLVISLDGQSMLIPSEKKALYHAALVMASNYMVTLYGMASQLLTGIGADDDAIEMALTTLMTATLANLTLQGIPDALTGPLTRADIGTLETHLKALSSLDAGLVNVYIELARRTYPILRARHMDTSSIEQLFKQQEKYHAFDDPRHSKDENGQ